MDNPLATFQPAVSRWFEERFDGPTDAQRQAWPAIGRRAHTLISAPTGSGKTLAAFLSAIDGLVRQAQNEPLPDTVQVLYVSPLKALSNDIRTNLEEPLAGIERQLEQLGHRPAGIRTLVRTGDTPASERTRMLRQPPHILVTTPESLYILLTSEGGRGMLRSTRTVIVDEIHAVAGNKRGSHLALTLERLQHLVEQDAGTLTRIGLSATQRPIERIGRLLVGDRPDCTIVDTGHRREMDLTVEMPRSPLEAVMPGEVWKEIYDRLAELVEEHSTTLIFVNTRRLAERVARHLSERLGEQRVTAHHGSLSREQRLDAEQRLKQGQLAALVATASLELGIDVGSIDLVCNIGSTRSIATLLQRVGRSGHQLGAVPKGRLFPTSRDELVECAALFDAVRRDELERIRIRSCPLDVLAQQIVATVATGPWAEDALFDRFRRAWPYRDLPREAFDAVVGMLSEGFSTRRGRRRAYLHRDIIHGKLRARRGARLAAITSGGAIPDNADYRVVLEPGSTFVGTVDEDFAIESLPGDIFQLGNSAWRIQRIEQGRVLVEDARGQSPTIPFWFGEAPGRSRELSRAVARLRGEIGRRLEQSAAGVVEWLAEEIGTGEVAARQIIDYLAAGRAALGTLPDSRTLVLERFFDEAGNQHVVIHSPHGSRLNRAWGLALRKRFCRNFNFELQAAATEDAIVLSLGPTHSYPAEETFRFLHSNTVRDVLVQALLDAPMFAIRWRWNAGRSLALLRWQGGRKVPPRLQRMQAEDLIALIFPDQLACLENIAGEREVPEHPLVGETIRDCLEEAMDIDALEQLLREIEAGERELVVRELREPSPLAHEIITARPYAFLDDAPLEERRTMAVATRRWLDAESAADLGRLDVAAIERVRDEVRPRVEDAEELHDALVIRGFIGEGEASAWNRWLAELAEAGRATKTHLESGCTLWVAAERWPQVSAIHPGATSLPELNLPASLSDRHWGFEEALVELLRARLETSGPVTVAQLADDVAADPQQVGRALTALEVEGFAMQGHFTPRTPQIEWCERRLLARIHRYTLKRLRSEIRPVSKTDFMRFLLVWQHAGGEHRLEGSESVVAVLDQLRGFDAPAVAWEADILPARIADYDPLWLDGLCLSGRLTWLRGGARPAASGTKPIRSTPIRLVPRAESACWSVERGAAEQLSPDARRVFDVLETRGASFFEELVSGSALLRSRVEQALAELVANGLASSDSYTGLRALLTPSDRRRPLGKFGRRGKRSAAAFGMETAGRWSCLPVATPPDLEIVARSLLQRYGVVFRRVLSREPALPPWRDLLRVYRRLEARGEIRGGRFVDGFSGEQFALAEAIGAMRKIRRRDREGELVSTSAADPLNLTGIVTPGARVAALSGNRLLYRDGELVARLEAGQVSYLVEAGPAEQWQLRNALLRRRIPPRLKAYVGGSA